MLRYFLIGGILALWILLSIYGSDPGRGEVLFLTPSPEPIMTLTPSPTGDAGGTIPTPEYRTYFPWIREDMNGDKENR